jgi:preprotein translocase subunit YajC
MEFLTKLLGIATAVAETTTTTGAADPAAVTTDSAAGGILFSLLPLLLVFVLMYFMMIRPEKKRRKKEQDMLASLKKGDRVCTIGGIYATIESIKDDTITLSVGKGDQTMVVARWAIRSVEDVTIENETESLN